MISEVFRERIKIPNRVALGQAFRRLAVKLEKSSSPDEDISREIHFESSKEHGLEIVLTEKLAH